MSEGSNLEQTTLPRRDFFKKILPLNKPTEDTSQEKKKQSFDTNPIKGYGRRKFLELTAKGVTSVITTVALEKLSNFISNKKDVFAQDSIEGITDQKCEEFFRYCHNRIGEIDTKGNQKTDNLVLELAEFNVEFAVSLYSFFSSQQKLKFREEIDYLETKIDDLRTDSDWDLDAESSLQEIGNIPSWLLPLREHGLVVASEVKEKSNASTHLSIIHFGDRHEWDSRDNNRYSSTLKGHDEIYKMYKALYVQNFAIIGYEDDPVDGEGKPINIQQYKELKIKELKKMQGMIDSGRPSELLKRRVREMQNKLADQSVFRIYADYSDVNIIGIDKYKRNISEDHNSSIYLRDKADSAYRKACALYYDVKRENLPGDIKATAQKVIEREKILSSLEKQLYDERSRYAIRRMIAEMLLSRTLKGAIIFGAADGKYFLEEVKKINKNGESFLSDLQKDNEEIYKKITSTYSLAELKQLSIELYMVIPKAFRPYE
ncbi:MAG TPA: hypothetical protein VJB63_01450 [Patescibacteria group bacterium]|nr:hypothetical protein [Patescibacteria group bacterium]